MLTKVERRAVIQNRCMAMSHPLRAEILRLLVETRRPLSPAEVARRLEERVENVSHHMKRLVSLDCAELVEEKKVRGAVEHFYRATARSLISTEEWPDLHPLESHRIKAEVVQMVVDDFVAGEREQIPAEDGGEFFMTRTPIMLDRQGLHDSLEILERARHEIAEIERQSLERNAGGGEPTFPASSSQLLFRIPRSH